MNYFGNAIQFMFFIVVILIIAKIFGFADNGTAVIAACVIGGLAYGVLYFIFSKLRNRKEEKKSESPLKGKAQNSGNKSGKVK